MEALKTTARETRASLRDLGRRLSVRLTRIPATMPTLQLPRKPLNLGSCGGGERGLGGNSDSLLAVVPHGSISHCSTGTSPPRRPRVDRASLGASAIPQLDSGLFAKLPYDVRLLIYEQVWADAGTDQHIVQVRIGSAPARPRPSRHASANRELTHFSCVCGLSEGEGRRRKLGAGSLTEAYWGAKNQFMRPWCRHWECDSVPVGNVDQYLSSTTIHSATGGTICGRPFGMEKEKEKEYPSSPFLGLLLSCKTAYLEAVVSLYQNIRFCFMDYFHLESFLRVVPLEHLRNIRSIHLCECVSANLFMCQDHTAPRWTAVWSYIPLLENLQELHIWLYPSWVGRELPENDLLRIMYHIKVPDFVVEIPRDERPDDYLPEHKEAPFKLLRPVVEFSQKDSFQTGAI
ncbi:uncharacterized protein MKZ38_006871 [Zalerion maritima]|uniref:DUF7730 domain-containing protein n=1 Tax=Zalerion maritima TaxID=339359 RepID=A0AAD5WQ38_9PEZI|nr:uncharacterized protein MKZ38_006871 [Zalerion maritima]